MIEEAARIVRIEQNFAWIETSGGNACGHCSASAGCGTATLQKWFSRKPNILRVENSIHAGKGDRVVIGIPEQALVLGSFLIYIVPLISLILGAILGAKLNEWLAWDHRDLVSILAGVAFFSASLVLLKKYLLQGRHRIDMQPVILRLSH